MTGTLAAISELYRTVDLAIISHYRLDDEAFLDYSAALQDLIKEMGPDGESAIAAPVLRYLKRLRYTLTTTPLLPARVADLVVPPTGWPEQQRSTFALAHPGHVARLDEAWDLFSRYRAAETTGLRDALAQRVVQALDEEGVTSSSIVVGDVRWLDETQAALRQLLPDHWERTVLLHHRALRNVAVHEVLFLLGPARWYPQHVLTTPKAPTIEVLSYGWVRDDVDLAPSFDGPGVKATKPVPSTRLARKASRVTSRRPEIDLDDLLPGFTRGEFTRAAEHEGASSRLEAARVFVLEGGWGVFLSDERDSRAFVLDQDERGNVEVHQKRVTDIQVDEYLVVRTQGGGDYVRAVADSLLDAEARPLRALQARWKDALNDHVDRYGYTDISRGLQGLGLNKASPSNVARWASQRSIGPGEPGDLEIIFNYVELHGQSVAEHWDALEALRAAHRDAGLHIREQLIEAAEACDLGELERAGSLTFEIEGVEAGALLAARVDQVGAESYEVPAYRIGDPFELEEVV